MTLSVDESGPREFLIKDFVKRCWGVVRLQDLHRGCRERVEELERAKLQLSSKGDQGAGDTDRFKRHGFGQGEFGMKSRDGSLDRERQEGKPRDAGR